MGTDAITGFPTIWAQEIKDIELRHVGMSYSVVKAIWCNGMGLKKHLTGKKHDAAYEYMNWYMSGWQGAFVCRYGYYSPVEAERGVRKHCDVALVRTRLNQQKPSVLGSVLPELIETSVQRPPLPLSCVRESGAMSICQNDRGSASSAQTRAARITEA